MLVTFDDDIRVLYDLKDDIKNIKDFEALQTETSLFKNFQIDQSRTSIYWSDRIDLASDTILEYGQRYKTTGNLTLNLLSNKVNIRVKRSFLLLVILHRRR